MTNQLLAELEALQQAKDKLQNDYQEAVNKIQELKERYEILKKEHIDTITRNEEKQQIIDKAIEYIKKDYYTIDMGDIVKEDLLEILGGKENEK